MQIQSINNSYNNKTPFKAKFLNTYSLRKVAEWAKENGKFEELNEARKRIDSTALNIRLELTLGRSVENDYPIAIFRRYIPNNALTENPTENDFTVSKPVTYQSRMSINPFEFGFKKIIQMSNYVTENKMYREIVIRPPRYTD